MASGAVTANLMQTLSRFRDPQALPKTIFLGIDMRENFTEYLVLLVGAAGFEPTTPCPPDKCANRAAPRPDRNGADYRAVRVR